MNNTVLHSTGFSPVQLVFGHRLRTLPGIAHPLSFLQTSIPTHADWTLAADHQDLWLAEARNNLLLSKHCMALHAN